jgi:hypothetical protein
MLADAKQDFDEILRDAVKDGISSLGDSPKQVVFHYLKTEYSIDVLEISRRTIDLDTAINALMGEGGRFLEDMILDTLNQAIGFDDTSRSNGEKGSFRERVERAAEFHRSRCTG